MPLGSGVAEQVGEHLAEDHDRDRQQKVPPEEAAELFDVIAVPAVTAVAGVVVVAAGVVVVAHFLPPDLARADRRRGRSVPASSLRWSNSRRQCSRSGSGKVSASR